MADTPEQKLAALGLTIPTAAAPAANYVPYVISGWQLHIAGQIPFDTAGALIKGRLGDDLDINAGTAAAERCAIGLIAQMKAALGELKMVRRIVKLNVFVQSAPGFTDQPEVANGASNLMVAVFGDAGRHARAAVGVAALPRGVAVEIDAIVEINA
jgi:enamine deaminase RidA (YjgF/YER057c/UK114 family)